MRGCERRTSQKAGGVRNRRPAGSTVVELVVTISIAAILTTVAVPSFSGLIASQRAKTVASELFASLLKTRAEAIMRNANVTVSPLTGGWHLGGWDVLYTAKPAHVLDSLRAAGS